MNTVLYVCCGARFFGFAVLCELAAITLETFESTAQSKKPMARRTDPNGKPPAENDFSAGRRAAFRLGLSADRQAAALLFAKGYRVVARRLRTGVGEVDIVARRGDLLVFVEVKARERLDDAAEAVTPRQQRRIIVAAEAWLAKNPD